MARRRRRRRRMTALQRQFFGKRRKRRRSRKHHTRKARHHVAKRRRRRHHRRGHRRTHRRRGGGGATRGLLPGRDDFKMAFACGAIGFLEAKAKGDANFFLNKVPRPVKQLGYTGGTWLALTVANHFIKHPVINMGRRAAFFLTAYQLGSTQKAFDASDKPMSLSGFDDDHLIDVGALSAEGEEMSGIPFDDRINDPMV